jgi:hypothetical protein
MGPRISITQILALAVCLAVAAALGAQWERALAVPCPGGVILRAQEADGDDGSDVEAREQETAEYTSRETRTEKGTSQRIFRAGGDLKAQYQFINFNKDRVGISFGMRAQDYRRYLADYGYSEADVQALRAWRETTRQAVWKNALQRGDKAAGEKAVADVDTEYDTRLRAMMRAHGMALRAGNLVECDVPLIVKRNTALMKPLAMSFQKIAAERGYSEEDLVGAVLSLVQTAVRYKIPPDVENGVHTGGLLPPARTLLSGWGDCDTKTALLASILSNWNGLRMVGIAVPGHYLMAIRRLPAKGDMFVRYEGLEYVLLEPAGPAWLEPGSVGTHTTELLAGSEGYTVEPFF